MATPTYKGQSQPTASSGGWLSNWFGGSTPAYITAAPAAAPTAAAKSVAASPASSQAAATPMTASQVRSFFAMAAPAYKVVSSASEFEQDDGTADLSTANIAIVIPREAIDPQT